MIVGWEIPESSLDSVKSVEVSYFSTVKSLLFVFKRNHFISLIQTHKVTLLNSHTSTNKLLLPPTIYHLFLVKMSLHNKIYAHVFYSDN